MKVGNFVALLSVLVLSSASFSFGVHANELVSKSPDGAKVYIISPVDGQTVPATFKVQFGLSGMGVAPAGMDRKSTGHHHILIDVDTLPNMSASLPATDSIKHYGALLKRSIFHRF